MLTFFFFSGQPLFAGRQIRLPWYIDPLGVLKEEELEAAKPVPVVFSIKLSKRHSESTELM